MTLKINIIFHKKLDRDAYNFQIPFIKKYFQFIAVNDKIPKSIPADLDFLVLKETSIKESSPKFQEKGLKENSVLLHFHMNPYLLEGVDHIGFFRYDMKFSELFAEHLDIIQRLTLRSPKHIFVLETQVCERHLLQILGKDNWDTIIDIYNKKYGKSHSFKDIYFSSIPLFNSFILPKHIFNEMMKFFNDIGVIVTNMLKKLNKEEVIAQIFERCNGLFLRLYSNDNNCPWYTLNGIDYTHSLKYSILGENDKEIELEKANSLPQQSDLLLAKMIEKVNSQEKTNVMSVTEFLQKINK
jgi:hypothetical protein